MNNIYLTGLSGSGKTTLGAALARKLHRLFIDTDRHIEERQGKSIGDIFTREGEPAFRALERGALLDAAAERGAVVATGGGSVLDGENVSRMRASGLIVFIDRPPEAILRDLDLRSRPLLRTEERFWSMVRERAELYVRSCDRVLPNDGTVERALALLEDIAKTVGHVV